MPAPVPETIADTAAARAAALRRLRLARGWSMHTAAARFDRDVSAWSR